MSHQFILLSSHINEFPVEQKLPLFKRLINVEKRCGFKLERNTDGEGSHQGPLARISNECNASIEIA